MTFYSVDCGWDTEFIRALNQYPDRLCIVCPFINDATLARIHLARPDRLQNTTRFNFADFAQRVSNIDALRRILELRGTVRGIRNLHAKLYILFNHRAIIASANLTGSGLSADAEFGICTEATAEAKICIACFEDLWRSAESNPDHEELHRWDCELAGYWRAEWAIRSLADLPAYGAEASLQADYTSIPAGLRSELPQEIVRFFETARDIACLTVIAPLKWSTTKAATMP